MSGAQFGTGITALTNVPRAALGNSIGPESNDPAAGIDARCGIARWRTGLIKVVAPMLRLTKLTRN
jgi:hypothetical protein